MKEAIAQSSYDDGFWFYRPEANFPPPCIQNPSEMESSDRLAIACTQTRLTPSQQKRLVGEWCAILPALEGIKYLWLNSRVPDDLFCAACRIKGLEGLYIKWSGIKDLSPIKQSVMLRFLHIGNSPGISSLAPLHALRGLLWLELENFKRISDLSELARLRGLHGLALDGSMWSTWTVNTLHPIGQLADLRYLSICNLRSRDKTLRPLLSLNNLQTFHHAAWWNEVELREIEARIAKRIGHGEPTAGGYSPEDGRKTSA